MKWTRIALLWVLCSIATAFAADGAGLSRVDPPPGRFFVAQSGGACLSTCQDAYKSCLAKIEPGCNSRGCSNEKNACILEYNDCTKKCGN